MNEKEKSELIDKCIEETLKTSYLLGKKTESCLSLKQAMMRGIGRLYFSVLFYSLCLFGKCF